MTRLRALTVVGLILFAAWEPGVVVGGDGWQTLNVPVPVFEVQDLEGRTLRARDLAGQVAVIDFWATWCAPCVIEMPDLVEFHRGLAGRKDVAFLSFAATEEKNVVATFAKKHELPFRVFLADAVQDAFGIDSYPTKLIVDFRDPKQAVVRFRRDGTATGPELHEKLQALLKDGAAKKGTPARP